ncbi:MAG: hypothetical protein GXO83_13690 [Chlorobi bacterium]|nr:hypothetical protein [Chlorobiota bacterium]
MKLRYITYFFIIPALSVGFSFCARVGNPSGGPKDKDPPKVIYTDPENYSTHFDARTITIVFDEYIKLDKVNQKLVISPPLAERPDIRIRGKGIVINLNDTLRNHTTYTFNFGDAITDNNEGNILVNFSYVFSTGDALDSLETGGKIVDAFTLKVPKDTYAALYDDLDDSAALLQKPLYISKIDKKGTFALRNLKQDTFRIIGLADANGNFRYDPGVDMIGFLDTLLILDPKRFAPVHISPGDTSAAAKKKKKYAGPEIYLRLFLEDVEDQYLKSNERPGDEFFWLIFNRPTRDVSVRLASDTTRKGWFIPEKFVKGDTLGFWLTDTSLVRQEKIKVLVSYPVLDSTQRWIFTTDTVTLQKKGKGNIKQTRARTAEPSPPPVKKAVIITSASSRQPLELKHQLILSSATPVQKWDTSRVTLTWLQDTLKNRLPFTLRHDTSHLRNYILQAEWQPETKYQLTFFPGALTDIYGDSNDTLLVSFQTRKTEDYGNLKLNLKGISGQTIILLQDVKGTLFRQTIVYADTSISFLYLKPNKYKVKAISDLNGNGKWDTGNYLQHRQPEPVSLYSKTLNIRANWDIEENWTLRFKL